MIACIVDFILPSCYFGTLFNAVFAIDLLIQLLSLLLVTNNSTSCILICLSLGNVNGTCASIQFSMVSVSLLHGHSRQLVA